MLTLIVFTNRLLRSSPLITNLVSIPTDPSQTILHKRAKRIVPTRNRLTGQVRPSPRTPRNWRLSLRLRCHHSRSQILTLTPPARSSSFLLPSVRHTGSSDHPQLAEANISFKEPWKFSPVVENWGTAKLPEWSGTSPGGSELSTPGQLSRAGNSRRRRLKLCKEHTFKLAKDWSQFHSDCPFNSSPKMKHFSFGLLIHTNYGSHF